LETTNIFKLRQALSAHRPDGRYSLGTAPIVESLHTDLGLSYEQIADIAGVSLAGLRRWRELNRGDRATFGRLLKYAENKVNGETSEPGDTKDTLQRVYQDTDQPHAFPDTRQVPPLTIAVDPAMIEIVIKG